MQYLTRVLSLIGCSLLGGEKKTMTEVFFTAQLNGQPWEAVPDAYLECLSTPGSAEVSMLQLVGVQSHQQGYWFDRLRLPVPFPGARSFSLTRDEKQPRGTIFSEGESDALVAVYYPTNDSSANRMEITRYDAESGLMEGTFRTTLVVEEVNVDDPMRRQPDTLRFTEGRFRVTVEDHRDVTGNCG